MTIAEKAWYEGFLDLYQDIVSNPALQASEEALHMAVICGKEDKITTWKDKVDDVKKPDFLAKILSICLDGFSGRLTLSVEGIMTFASFLKIEDYTRKFTSFYDESLESLIDLINQDGHYRLLEDAITKGLDVKMFDTDEGNTALNVQISRLNEGFEPYLDNDLCDYSNTLKLLVRHGAKIGVTYRVNIDVLNDILALGRLADNISSNKNINLQSNAEIVDEESLNFLSARCKALAKDDKYTKEYISDILRGENNPTSMYVEDTTESTLGKRKADQSTDDDDNPNKFTTTSSNDTDHNNLMLGETPQQDTGDSH